MNKLINRNLFFDNPTISGGVISHNGLYVSFMKEYDGIMNLWVKRFDESFEEAVPLTKSKSPILGHFWSFDNRYILYVNDSDGDENINIFKIKIDKEVASFPESTNLTPLKEVTAQIYLVSEQHPNKLMIGLNDRDKAWHDLYELDIGSGDLNLKQTNNDRLTGWEFDWDENPRIAYRTDHNGFTEVLRINADQSTSKILTTNLQESVTILKWLPDNSKCYMITNIGNLNFLSLCLLNLSTGEYKFIENDPQLKSDLSNVFFDRATRSLLFTAYTYDKTKRYWKNKDWEKDFIQLEQELGGKEYEIVSKTYDGDKILISVSSDVNVVQMYCFDRKNKSLTLQYTTRPELQKLNRFLSPMKSIAYPSSDGLMIPAYLTVPKGGVRPLPLVVLVHGGPKGPRDYWGYNGTVQFLANRGYAVLQPNFRASGGFGKEFLNAGDKEWGKKMQDDITWGVKHLINEGIVNKEKVAIMGGSYGGYATLAGLAFTPDVYACGIDIVGPSNLFTLLESIPPYWEAGRKWLYEMVGDPDTEEGKALLKEASPLFSADRIKKPLLIVQGANDPRVKKTESDQIVAALSSSDIPFEYLCAYDEGHGFRKPINSLAMYAEIEKFLAEHLGGRYQESIEKEVYKNLKKLRQ